MVPTLGHLVTCLLTGADRRPRGGGPGSGGRCRARRHVGWTRGRRRHRRRSPRNTRRGRATSRGRAGSHLVSRSSGARRRSGSEPPTGTSGLRSQPEAIGTDHRPYGRTHLPLRSIGSDKLSPPFTACTCRAIAAPGCARPRPWRARAASRPRRQKIRVGALCLAVLGSHRASPGDPGGALYGRRTVPTVRGCVRAPSRGSEGVNYTIVI